MYYWFPFDSQRFNPVHTAQQFLADTITETMVGKDEVQVEKWTEREVDGKIAAAYQSLRVTQDRDARPIMSIPVSVGEYTAILTKV